MIYLCREMLWIRCSVLEWQNSQSVETEPSGAHKDPFRQIRCTSLFSFHIYILKFMKGKQTKIIIISWLYQEETVRIKKVYRKRYKMELTEAIMNKCGKKAGLLIAQIVMRYPSCNTKLTKPSKVWHTH